MASDVQVWRSGGALGRRGFLVGTASAAALAGCGYFPPEQGDAYAPWDFPGDVRDPAELAVRAAILAASPHNTQPWLFTIEGEVIDVYADLDRELGTMDGLRREMYLGLGCAIENLTVAAAHAGAAGTVELLPDPTDDGHVARVTLGSGAAGDGSRFVSIAARHTHRGPYADLPLDAGTLDELRGFAGAEADVGVVLVTDADGRGRVRSGTIAATEAIIADEEMSRDSFRWFRQTAAEIAEHRDGVTLDAAGLGAVSSVFGKLGDGPGRAKSDRYWLRNTKGAQTTGAGFVILTTPGLEDRGQQLRCGRVFQRIALWATGLGLAMQPLNQMPERRDRELVRGLAPEFTELLAGFTGEAHVQMLFRVGLPWAGTHASPRRPLDWVVTS